MDIATLIETRFAGETQLEEVSGDYTFYCIGKPEQDTSRTSGSDSLTAFHIGFMTD